MSQQLPPKSCTCKGESVNASPESAQECRRQFPCKRGSCSSCNIDHPARTFLHDDSIVHFKARVNHLLHIMDEKSLPRPLRPNLPPLCPSEIIIYNLKVDVWDCQQAGVQIPQELSGEIRPRQKLLDMPTELLHNIMGKAVGHNLPFISYNGEPYINTTPYRLHCIECDVLKPFTACAKVFDIGLKEFIKMHQPQLEFNTSGWRNIPQNGKDDYVDKYINHLEHSSLSREVVDAFLDIMPEYMLSSATHPSISIDLGVWRSSTLALPALDIEGHDGLVANAAELIDRLPLIFPKAQGVDIHFNFRSGAKLNTNNFRWNPYQPLDLSMSEEEMTSIEQKVKIDIIDLVEQVMKLPISQKQVSIEVQEAIAHSPGMKHDCRDKSAEEVVEELLGETKHKKECAVTYWLWPSWYVKPVQQ